VKLTQPQLKLLLAVYRGWPYNRNDSRPANALVRLKLISRWEGLYGSHLQLTLAGLKLAEEEAKR
jgi:hypothetical protein